MVSIKDDIATCLRMLRARGGALDLKAADFIEAMDSVGTRQQTEIQALGKRIAALESTLAGDPAELSTLRTEFRGAMHELDEVRVTLAKALKTELHDGDTAFLLAHHVAQLVSALRLNRSWLHGDQWTPEEQRAFLLEGPDPIIKVKGTKA